uniref:Signal recognition particle 9 kDa protein n=1 Tax=Physcomitrium patens TaxID=3218 RepID=A0A7I4D2D7_PHYPA
MANSFSKSPTIKWITVDGEFCRECLKFKTVHAQDIRKMEKLNNTFFSMMARGPDVEVPEDLPKEPVAPPPSRKGRGRRQ